MTGPRRGGPILAALSAAALAALSGACGMPPLKIVFEVSGGPVQACPAAAMSTTPTCSDVPMLCDAVLNIRIVRPSNPQETYLPLCEEIPFDRERDLCSIANIDLPASQLPKETLEVQVMVWPRDAVKQDPTTLELDCREIYGQPVLIGFGLHGFPEEVSPSPALGGRAYYHPGDEQTVVTLGCSDLPAVNRAACFGPAGLEVSASIHEFGRFARSVPASLVDELIVSVGEPRSDGRDEYRLESTSSLDPVELQPGQDPRWYAAVPDIEDTMCVQVINTNGANAATVRCDRIAPTERKLYVTGFWLPSEMLDRIVESLMLPRVPAEGLTIGVVLDSEGRPAGGYEVRVNTGGTVRYLSPTLEVASGETATTSSGLFVSEDAPYHTEFTARSETSTLTGVGLGGKVRGKVTIVVLQLAAVSA